MNRFYLSGLLSRPISSPNLLSSPGREGPLVSTGAWGMGICFWFQSWEMNKGLALFPLCTMGQEQLDALSRSKETHFPPGICLKVGLVGQR